jgi:RNA polymerase sigma-54 factor
VHHLQIRTKTGQGLGEEVIQEIIPDVYVYKVEGEYVISLNDEDIPRLKVNQLYRSILTDEQQIFFKGGISCTGS